MKRILGLDLGVNSIGWALVNEAELKDEKSSIVKAGVRVTPIITKELDNFTCGKKFSLNMQRRMARGARRNLQRFKMRRFALASILRKNGIISEDVNLFETGNNTTFETYRLRAKAATEEISLEGFARVLMMINKKRGYKSSRKTNNSDEDGQSIDGIDIALTMEKKGWTPAQYHLDKIERGESGDPEFYRSDLKSELGRIIASQSQYYPEIFNGQFAALVENKTSKVVRAIFIKEWQVFAIDLKGKDKKREALQMRVDALSQKMDLDKLAYVVSDICGKIANSSGYLGAISDRSKELELKGITVGQYLMQKLENDSNAPIKNQVFYRKDYFEEFLTIWDKQAAFHRELTPELKDTVAGIIFMQRPLKSQKGSVGYCEYESHIIEVEVDGKKKKCHTGSKVCPKSSPLFQEFRVLQLVNQVKVVSKDTGEVRPLDEDERKVLVAELTLHNKLKKAGALKCLFKKPKDWDMNYEELSGNETQSALFDAYKDILSNHGYDTAKLDKLPAAEAIDTVRRNFEKWGIATDFITFHSGENGNAMKEDANYKLWHLLYSYEGDNSNSGNDKLIEKIVADCGMDREDAKVLARKTFPNDYSSLSAKAMLKLLPYLKQGMIYSDACQQAGYKSYMTKEENENRTLVSHLDNIPKNSLRSPVVEKILNQMVNVVNALVERYGKIDEVRIELARELKKNAEEREKLSKANEKSRKENETLREELLGKEIFQNIIPTKNDIIRYRLYKELVSNGYKTLYSNTPIEFNELFTEKYEIEHIIPKARLFDDSYSNKTLELSSVNKLKDKKTAFDFVLENYGEEEVENYKKRVADLLEKKAISKTKHDHLLMRESDIPEDFLNRDLAQTQYISKKARQILLSMFRNVTVTTGSITARLREDWQLVDVMQELNMPKFDKLNMTYEVTDRHENTRKYIKDWSKRNDHRHHAMDAITIAFTKHAYVQYLNNVNAHNEKTGEVYGIQAKYLKRDKNGNLRFIPPIPLPQFRRETEKQLSDILISIKAKNKVLTRNVNKTKVPNSKEVRRMVQFTPRGELHEATVYGVRKCYVTSMVPVGGNMDMQMIAKVANKKYREALACRLVEFDNDPKQAFTGKNSLQKNPLYFNSFDTVPEKVKIVEVKTQYTKRKPVDKSLNVAKVVDAEVRRALEKRIAEFGGNQDKAFSNLDEQPIVMKNGKTIKRVVVAEDLKSVVALHDKKDQTGKVMLDETGKKQPADYVTPGNNHHVAIFMDQNGDLQEHIVTFHEVVMRALQGLPPVDMHYHADLGWTFQFSMKKNEYFVFPNAETGFNPQTVDLTNPANFAAISPNLFRVQKLSSKYYCFRHHLETSVEDIKNLKEVTWKRITRINDLQMVIKVRVNHLGEIVSVGEYL